MQPNNTGGDEAKLGVGGCIVLLVLAAITVAVLWFVGNIVWDCLVNIFGDDGGNSSRLARYCAGKFARGSYLYRECIDDGWKPWYSTAQWLN